jgi:flagellar motor switch protein FliM
VSQALSPDQDVLAEPHDGSANGHGRRQRRVREVDFARPTKFTPDQQRRIARGHDSFCRAISTLLSAEVRTPVEFEVVNVDQQTWSSAVSEIPQPSLLAVLGTSHQTQLLLSIERWPALVMVERLLGGVTASKPPEGELTEIEIALARRILGTIVGQLTRTWEELLSTTLQLWGLETQQAGVQLASASEPTLVVAIETRLEGETGSMRLLLPYRAMESVLDALSAGQYGDHGDVEVDPQAEESVRLAVRGIEVELRAEIGSCELTVDEVLALAPGDVLRLGSASSGCALYADNVAIHRTKPGRSGTRRAVEILGQIEGA